MEAVTSDGLVRKRVIVEGNGEEAAGRGAKVTVKYTLRANNKTIDSSAALPNGELTFTQGRRKVIAALDAAVQSMTMGERCMVEAAPAYAFGRRGLSRKGIAPDTPVELDVELIRFDGGEKKKPLSDMTPKEIFDQALICKEAGNALFKQAKFEKAMLQYSQCIRCVSNVFYKPRKTSSSSLKPTDSSTTASTNIVTEDQQTKQSQQSEETQPTVESEQTETADKQNQDVRSNAHTNGSVSDSAGTEHITENGNVEQNQDFTEATVVENEETDGKDDEDIVTVDATAGGIVVDSNKQHEQTSQIANDETTNGTDNNSNNEERKEEEVVQEEAEEEEEEENDDPEEEEVNTLHVTALNNLSLCLVKMDDFKRAVESASAALQLDPENSKAFYYRGRALVSLGEWDKAKKDLHAALNIQPNNLGIRMELAKLDKKIKSFENLERKQAAAMFA